MDDPVLEELDCRLWDESLLNGLLRLRLKLDEYIFRFSFLNYYCFVIIGVSVQII